MNEEELKAKEAELKEKEEDLQRREDAMQAKEADLQKREEDVNGLVAKITKEYEAKLKKQEDDFKKRLDEREKVIKQLLNGDENAFNKAPSEIEILNARRNAQRRGWPLDKIAYYESKKGRNKRICQQIKVVQLSPCMQMTF